MAAEALFMHSNKCRYVSLTVLNDKKQPYHSSTAIRLSIKALRWR